MTIRRLRTAAVLVSLVFVCVSHESSVAPVGPASAKDRHVVVIGVDGLAAFYLQNPNGPPLTFGQKTAQRS